MSLEFMDGFDHYTSNGVRKWYASTAGTSAAAGRFGGNALRLFNDIPGRGVILGSDQLSSVKTRVAGFAFKVSALSNLIVSSFLDNLTVQSDWRLTNAGTMQVTRNGTLLATSTLAIAAGTWYYVELKYTIGNSDGAAVVRVDGLNWISVSGVDTQDTANATTNGFKFHADTGANEVNIDDLYILNTSGSRNNDMLGECRVLTTLPNADGSTVNWTPNSGTAHFSRVNESSPDDDTSYVSSATPGQIDTYTFPAITVTGAIAGVQTTICDRKDDAGLRTLCAEYRSSGGSNFDGASFSPTSSYLMHRQLYETDPASGSAWTAAGVNGGQFGVKCVA